MIRLLATCLLFGFAINTYSQEKFNNGIQIGFPGIWIHNELRVSEGMVLRSELGIVKNFDELYYPDINYLYIPTISLELKYYYNLKKRQEKGKNIVGNSGNFFSMGMQYAPSQLAVIRKNSLKRHYSSSISIIPYWGIRRNIHHRFNYEAGIGFGYRHFSPRTDIGVIGHIFPYFHVRIGYRL